PARRNAGAAAGSRAPPGKAAGGYRLSTMGATREALPYTGPMSGDEKALVDAAADRAELLRVIELLEAVVSDRALLGQLAEPERTRLLVAAGRVVHPDLQQKRRLVRSLRTAERRRAEARDRAVLASTGIRAARQAEVFVPPPRALPGAPEPAREVETPKKC